jgi:hypothetical protein
MIVGVAVQGTYQASSLAEREPAVDANAQTASALANRAGGARRRPPGYRR